MHKKTFLHLSTKDQLEYFRFYLAENPNHSLEIAEKDLWVCWVLKQLFEMPDRLEIAFKGGTSLSKVFNVIERFSEDVDITIDYRQFEAVKELNLVEGQTAPESLGSGQKRRINKALLEAVKCYAVDVVAPYLREQIKQMPQSDRFSIDLEDDGQSIRFNYPSLEAGDSRGQYMRGYILIEFGGRNIINPNAVRSVSPYLSSLDDSFEFPTSRVTVLSAHRTFWEKATMMHVECHRGIRQDAMRLSRHWFDLMALSQHQIGIEAIADVALMRDVIALKSIFYNSGYANYSKCLNGEFVLVPDGDGLAQLRVDYEKMVGANYVVDTSLKFDQIIQTVKATEDAINTAVLQHL